MPQMVIRARAKNYHLPKISPDASEFKTIDNKVVKKGVSKH